MGVPRPDGHFGNCNPNDKKNHRTRCCALIKTKEETALIDTSPDLRQQLINNKVKQIDKVLRYLEYRGDYDLSIRVVRFDRRNRSKDFG